ncbi:hypothetical protein P3551_23070 [Vibrio parahaemolyticus]|uniref:hypothetical protein n=1 Tax=Vibrio parahaemolyticus TaxID=670 RepID=UPI00111D75CD|nr:hypothetical protein [Vibrio parahaemolyticus]MBE3985610.1 hypothetical protein [Vibrio parahaemolyticus]MBE4286386.1 hypothetical protein [Vibrio parahaemolyticus]MDF4902168.1 hypothetical protein [Vibrio parahaemolyticus]TOH19143.1 hypothetical protein CGI90_03960 [Vibrio parahaemolyticus]HCG7330427.1 hypothetical protein [Vibrio parahaemolyticus]
MIHKLLVLLIKVVGLVVFLSFCFALFSGVLLAYNAYIKPKLANTELQILLNHQRALLELKQEYGELVDGDISRQ